MVFNKVFFVMTVILLMLKEISGTLTPEFTNMYTQAAQMVHLNICNTTQIL